MCEICVEANKESVFGYKWSDFIISFSWSCLMHYHMIDLFTHFSSFSWSYGKNFHHDGKGVRSDTNVKVTYKFSVLFCSTYKHCRKCLLWTPAKILVCMSYILLMLYCFELSVTFVCAHPVFYKVELTKFLVVRAVSSLYPFPVNPYREHHICSLIQCVRLHSRY